MDGSNECNTPSHAQDVAPGSVLRDCLGETWVSEIKPGLVSCRSPDSLFLFSFLSLIKFLFKKDKVIAGHLAVASGQSPLSINLYFQTPCTFQISNFRPELSGNILSNAWNSSHSETRCCMLTKWQITTQWGLSTPEARYTGVYIKQASPKRKTDTL